MAWYYGTYSCGHEGRVNIIGPTKDRQWKADRKFEWICTNEDYEVIGDLCMGRGLVGLNAYMNGKRFVGTELNHKRLSVLVERIKEGKLSVK